MFVISVVSLTKANLRGSGNMALYEMLANVKSGVCELSFILWFLSFRTFSYWNYTLNVLENFFVKCAAGLMSKAKL